MLACWILCENGGKFFLVLGNKECLFVYEADKAGDGARWFFNEADGGVVNRDVRGTTCLAEMYGKLCGEMQCLIGYRGAACTQDDMGAGNVAHVQMSKGAAVLNVSMSFCILFLPMRITVPSGAVKENGCARRSLLRFFSFS